MSTPSVPEWSAEDIEALAGFMGYSIVRGSDDVLGAMRAPFPLLYMDGASVALIRHIMDPPSRWEPMADANADLQVLQRAREVWDVPTLRLLNAELSALASARWKTDRDGPAALDPPTMRLRYCAVGDYSRAVRAVLRSTEGETP